ncbi:uncharacterized protein LOC135215872 [Macrobrachium nipponense]|uniref:uncharacterized protein LOC135215872 n=1 Tax=Macrobrachium nipponense TaxID=159736 RepID=UPI0030C7BEB2
MKEAAKALRQREDITVRRADKTAAFVLIKTAEYRQKLDAILSDSTKFERLTKSPTDEIKKEANDIISSVNAATNAVHIPPIIGDYSLGYLYGNVKTQKNGNPLHLIISQTPAPTYGLAKRLNQILTPYVPSRYSLRSSTEFLKEIRDSPGTGTIASLDVESLFTNVPVDETINIIMDRIYRDPSTPQLNIPEVSLRTLLEICTKKAPFSTHKGQMFRQKDGVAIGSPLGVLFANFYMGTVEERIFSNIRKPRKYARYIDNIFVQAEDEEEVEAVRRMFQHCSSLNYTVEFSNEGQLPFLDVLISKTDDGLKTSVYTKQTNLGLCLNGDSECPARFKNTTVRAYIRRALTHCSSWQDTHKELDRVTQMLVNNGYPNRLVDKEVRTALDRWYGENERPQPHLHEKIKLYYKARMHARHFEDEDALRKIIKENVTPTEADKELELVIYYQN